MSKPTPNRFSPEARSVWFSTRACGGGPTTEDSAEIKALESNTRELRQPNEILRKAPAYFAQAELDRQFKR